MRFYPDADVNFFWEFSDGWDRYCRYPAKKTWSYKDWNRVRFINYWRDLEGAKKAQITDDDLYIINWLKDRKRPEACLPIYYAVGHRFIRVLKTCPVGFKCAPLPISLKELRKIKEKEKAEAKKRKEQAKLEKKAKKDKGKGKGKGRGKK